MTQENTLESASFIAQRIRADFGFTAVIATEIEFYLHGVESADMPAFWHAVERACAARGLALLKHEAEKGCGQFEVALAMRREAAQAVAQLRQCKALLTACAGEHGVRADFSAKPLADQPGSGLHVHVHLEDAAGNNVFFKRDAEISAPLKYAIGGLLATLREYMPVFAPNADSKARLAAGGTAPSTVSWGANNRTVAVRLPDAGAPYRHIEHRVAGADAEPGAVIAAVLAGIHYGLANQNEPGPQTYGDAGLEMYGLERIINPDAP